ncbi:MAG: hypothetical protein KAV87_43260, partial [Desulfobacteraceae bacterium]|nr:hypothetical protein [Desulfobacteraceae bacterium]
MPNITSTIPGLVKRFDKLQGARGNWETHWQDCALYCLPRKATITAQKVAGQKVPTTLYDSTGIQSAQVFAAGLSAYLTNPTSKWFALDLDNRELKEGGS